VNGLLDKNNDCVLTTEKKMLNDTFEDFLNNSNRTLFTANVINKHSKLLDISIVVNPFTEE
jgi:hypothetical protein